MQDGNNKILSIFAELGAKISQAWSRINFERKDFPDVALQYINEFQPHQFIERDNIVDAVLSNMHLPKQNDPHGEFGDAPITLFRNDRFFIDVLFWLDSSTTIHNHAFEGAFTVLDGASFHSSYIFDSRSPTTEQVRLGTLHRVDSEILNPGSARAIRGNHTIHSLVHLDRPTVSLVVRTRMAPDFPQHVYLSPGLAYDPRFVSEDVRKSCQLLKVLYQTDRHVFFSYFRKRVSLAEAMLACQLLLECGDFLEWDDLTRAASIAAEIHFVLDGPIQRAIFDAISQARLRDARRIIHAPRLRLLLALLAARADKSLARTMLHDLLRDDRSTDPLLDAIKALAEESEAEYLGTCLGYPLTSGNMRVLVDLMSGYTSDELAITLARESHQPDLLEEVRAIGALCRSSLFAPLL